MEAILAGLNIEQLPQDEWLRWHYDKEKMSASRAAGAMGFGRFSSPLQEYAELRGDIDRPDTTLAMQLGHLLEPTVATLYEAETGRITVDPGEYAIIRHPDFPWLFATLDRLTSNAEKIIGPLELKTTNSFLRSEWADGAPVAPQIQCTVQMMCAELTWGSIACLIGNSDFLTHDFLLDTDLAESILKSLDQFHTDVLAGNEPDATWQDGAVIKALHPNDNGRTIVSTDPHIVGLIAEYEALNAQSKQVEKNKDTAKFKLQSVIGDNTFLECTGVKYSFKSQTRKAYEVKENTFRVLRKVKM